MIEDLNAYFADFSVDAILSPQGGSPSSIRVIFDAKFLVVMDGVESCSLAATCKSIDVAAVKHDDTLTISGTGYRVIGIEPDGTGITVLILSKDSQ